MRLAIMLALASACEQSETPVRPDPVPVPIPTPFLDAGTLAISACYTIVLRVDRGGTWIGAPADVRCYAPFKAGAPDAEWIEAELRRLRAQTLPARCAPVVEVGAVAGITYQQFATPLETVWKNGFKLDLVAPDALAMTFDSAQSARTCSGALDLNKVATRPKLKRPPPPPPPPVTPTPGGSVGSITQIRRIAVSRDAIFLDGSRIVGTAELPAGTGTLASVANALGTATDDSYSVIVAADASTDAALVHRIVSTVKGAGYDYISFESAR